MAAIPVRPYLTAYEMAGGGRLDAEKTEASTRVLNNQAVESQLAAEGKRAELDSYYKKQAAFDLADKLAQENFMNSQNGGSSQPSSSVQPVVQPSQTVAPVQAAQPAQVAAPAPAPQAEGAQSFPIAAQPANNSRPLDQAPEAAPQQVVVTGKRMTLEEKAAYDVANPPAPAEQAPQPPVATPAPQPAPAVAAQAPVAPAPVPPKQQVIDEVRSTPVINGKINPLSDAVVDARIKAWQTLAEQGKVPMSIASEQINSIQAGRNAQLKANLDLREQVQKIQNSDLDQAEKKLKIASVIRENEDNKAYDIYKILQDDPAAARQYAKDNGYGDFDPTNPKDLRQLEIQASRAKNRFTQAAEDRAQAGERRAAAKEGRDVTTTKLEDAKKRIDLQKAAAGEDVQGLPGFKSTVIDGKTVIYNATSGETITAEQAQQKIIDLKAREQTTLAEGKPLSASDAKTIADTKTTIGNIDKSLEAIREARTLIEGANYGMGTGPVAGRVAPLIGANILDKNNARLQEITSDLVLGATGGKLGGGISNSDVDFMKDASGLIRSPEAAKKLKDLEDKLLAQRKAEAEFVNNNSKGKAEPVTDKKPTELSGNTPIIKSQAAYDALPSGAQYAGTDGKIYKKK